MVRRQARRGNAALVFLIALPVLVLVLLMVLHTGQLEQSRGEVQQVADAAALAAAGTLVDDDTLRLDNGQALRDLLDRSRAEARTYARANPVLGAPTELDPNPDNREDGDIVFGMIDAPPQQPIPADLSEADHLRLINTVRVNVVRSRERNNALRLIGGQWLNGRNADLTRSATAYLDRRVLGFRPVGDQPIPVVPFALLSERGDEDSWEQQVEHRGGPDEFGYDREPYRVRYGKAGDGLHEMHVRMPGKGADDAERVNCVVLHLGARHGTDLARQIRAGLTSADLSELGGELVLGPDGKLPVKGGLHDADPEANASAQVLAAFQELCDLGTVRAWPLFHRAATEAHGQPILSGFVAARVLAVSARGGGLQLVVQPACLTSASVVTGREDGPPVPLNRYLCKIRLIN